MELKDIPPKEWHNFKKTCPNIRLLFNETIDNQRVFIKRITELEECAEWQAEIKLLRSLAKYAQHSLDCDIGKYGGIGDCTCGLDELLNEEQNGNNKP